MTADKIIIDLKKGNYKPLYWLDGEEGFFIDEVIAFAEKNILNEAEAGFNLAVFYGKDASWADVINTCRRYPMFSDKQVVIIKEAQGMKDIDKLDAYFDKPLLSTLLFVAYKEKKLDGRTKLAKLVKDRAVVYSTKKLYENQLPDWAGNVVESRGLSIEFKALQLLIDHIGNDLARISNEIDKLALNLTKGKKITEDHIEKYIGVSKEFNVFELQTAIGTKNFYKAMRIIQYFAANPKAGPIQLILPSLYSYFSKLQVLYSLDQVNENSVAAALGVKPFFAKDYIQSVHKFNRSEVDKTLLLLHHYNLRSIGINDTGTEDGELLKEMVVKIMAA